MGMINRRRVMGGGNAANPFIQFADPAMKALCVGLWGGADGGTAALNTRVNNVKVTGVDGELTYKQAASIKSITDNQFKDNITITSFDELQYFTGLIAIGKNAFDGCSYLVSVVIPSSLTSISSQAFYQCASFTSITIPDSVTSIGASAFSRCTRLTSVIIGSGVTSISANGFIYCSKLTSIISLAITAPTIQGTTFRNVKTGGTLTVPSGSTGYDVWMQNANYYLGYYSWTKVEQ